MMILKSFRAIFLISFILLGNLSLWALDYGLRMNVGVSFGMGEEWDENAEDSGNRDFSDITVGPGAGFFVEFPLGTNLYLCPELSYAGKKGVRLATDDGDYAETVSYNSLQFILPTAYDLAIGSKENTAVRFSGGLALDYLLDLYHGIGIGKLEDEEGAESYDSLSLSFLLGGGMEFRRQKKLTIFTDLRFFLPITENISYKRHDESFRYRMGKIDLGFGVKYP